MKRDYSLASYAFNIKNNGSFVTVVFYFVHFGYLLIFIPIFFYFIIQNPFSGVSCGIS